MNEVILNFTEEVVRLHGSVEGDKRFRKSRLNGVAIPYSWHVIEVPKTIYRWGIGTEVNLLGGMGHDLREDCKLTEEQIISILINCGASQEVADAAARIITDLSFLPPEGISDEEQRNLKQEYLKGFANKPIDTILIKAADRLCNSWDFIMTDPRYAVKYFNKAAIIFRIIDQRSNEIDRFVYNNIMRDVDEFVEFVDNKI